MKLPNDVLTELERALEGLSFAKVNLEIVIHDKKPKYRIITEKSVIPGFNTSGGKPNSGETVCREG